ncbi:efflux transporter outer membrane subunit [Sphingomonas sp. IC-56]|uniref:efflux transporter outer membrane subunit n=1 Tax=Sphingomonas sp. IC-56 TaxID=2898529 RepID=UPI001E3DFC26|nr:efflux transporter outer membrane subunit [Sphingomonas sp. IC-56]MCD2324639.1 efflux transporter outer membrane subunit [Sphingomonas sp. IC-56]
MKRAALILLASVSLAGCKSMAPDYVRPASPVPPSWPLGDAYLAQREAALPAVTYQDIFRDERLQALIRQALVNNRDLRVAAANIRVAREQYRIQRADLLPELGVSGGGNVSGGSGGGSTVVGNNGGVGTGTGNGGTGTGTGGVGNGNGGTGNGAGNGGTVVGGGSGTRTRFSVNGGITSFEIDLFGRIASLTEAEQNRYFATEAAARATRLTLIGDIADAWLTYAADKSLLAIAQDTAESAERSVRLTRARLQGGIAPRTDLRQAEQILEGARADLAVQTTALAQDVNALQLLVGNPIAETLLPRSIDEAAPGVTELPAGVDSQVLLRRPDVVQAEYTLRAANAEIGAARAALFPRITLTGVLGLASDALAGLFRGDGFTWSGGANANYSIFNAGAARAGVRLTQAQRDASVAAYERTIQIAFREVADALARRGTVTEQLRATNAQAEAAADTYRLAEARYRGGIDTFLATLDAQRSLYAARRTLVTTRLTQASNLVTLYRTLGGDSMLDARRDGPALMGPDAQ